jgi:type I restriction enzyme S subunit
LYTTATGTKILHTAPIRIENYSFKIPNISEQKAIAHILGSLDDKIELNRQMNETLESMAQALFKSWFVDFDPVIDNALAAGNPIPDVFAERAEQRRRLKQESRKKKRTECAKNTLNTIQTQFPSEFEYTDKMGWIPKGWEAIKLSKLISIKHGFAFKGKYFSQTPTSNILLTPGNFKVGGGFKRNKLKFYNGPIPDSYILSKNDLLVTMTDLSKISDTLGFPAFVPNNKNLQFLHNQRLGKIKIVNNSIGKEFLYRCLCSKSYRNEILSSASGSTVKHTSPKKILMHKVVYSGGKIEKFFESLGSSFSEKQHKNDNNNIVLTKLRDTLLPKLLSGELRIPDAKKLITKVI